MYLFIQSKEAFIDRLVYLGLSLAASSLLPVILFAHKLMGDKYFYEINYIFAWFSFASILVGLNLKNMIFKGTLNYTVIRVLFLSVFLRIAAVFILKIYLSADLMVTALMIVTVIFEVSCWLRLKRKNNLASLITYIVIAVIGIVSVYFWATSGYKTPLILVILFTAIYNLFTASVVLERSRAKEVLTVYFYILPILEYLLLSFPRMYKDFEHYEVIVDTLFIAALIAMPIQLLQQRMLVTGIAKERNNNVVYVLFILCLTSFNHVILDALCLSVLLLGNSQQAYNEYINNKFFKLWIADITALIMLVVLFVLLPELLVIKWCLFIRYIILIYYESIAIWTHRKG